LFRFRPVTSRALWGGLDGTDRARRPRPQRPPRPRQGQLRGAPLARGNRHDACSGWRIVSRYRGVPLLRRARQDALASPSGASLRPRPEGQPSSYNGTCMDNFHGERGGVQTLLKSFDGYLRRRGRASSTRQQYAYSLRGFADWLGTSAVGDLTPANLELFLSHWEAEFRDSTQASALPRPGRSRSPISI
jgi:hypothetical protein